MTSGVLPARQERGWFNFLSLLASFLLLPFAPYLRALVPVEQTIVLLVPAVAACAVIGWWAGGRMSLAIVWALLAAWMLAQGAGGAEGTDRLARGWGLLLSASFGGIALVMHGRSFFPRALAALGITIALSVVVMTTFRADPSRLRGTMETRATTMLQDELGAIRQISGAAWWRDFVTEHPEFTESQADQERVVQAMPQVAGLIFPAMLGLESLAALALAWGLYHRIARARIGPPLAPLREFRFNDQLVWGLVVGVTVLLLPQLAILRATGVNLLLFFGALYLLRGLGVLTWYLAAPAESPPRMGRLRLLGVSILALLFWPFAGALALALGLGDTWVDWRRRARPTS